MQSIAKILFSELLQSKNSIHVGKVLLEQIFNVHLASKKER
jgi:hypothetical protein